MQQRTQALEITNEQLLTEIIERTKAEEALHSAYAYNRSLIDASLDPLVTITPEGKIGDVNVATEAVTGYARDELIGTDFHSYFTDPDKARSRLPAGVRAGRGAGLRAGDPAQGWAYYTGALQCFRLSR